MGLNESLKCPGLDQTLSVFPVDFNCPRCGAVVEIWSDEIKRRCVRCKTIVVNPDPLVKMPEKPTIETNTDRSKEVADDLSVLALDLGASEAIRIDSSKIKIQDDIAALCLETRCSNYGLSPTCPPHVKGPAWLREYIKNTPLALLIQMELTQELMYSEKRKEIAKLLHFIVVEIEKTAIKNGLPNTIAFAGGSCKNIHCPEHACCNVLNGDGKCRYPDFSRPSVSGYGINMNHLLKSVGWSQKGNDSTVPTSSRYGLVFLG